MKGKCVLGKDIQLADGIMGPVKTEFKPGPLRPVVGNEKEC